MRGDADIDRQLYMGVIMAKAFNAPRQLADDIQERQRAKRLEQVAATLAPDDALIELFRASGHEIVDHTKGAP